MKELMIKYDLCAKYCNVQSSPGACYNYHLKKCKGVCCDKEDITVYNERVQQALNSVYSTSETKIILDEGREFNERSVVLIENGIYKGFGYFSSEIEITSPEEAKEYIEPYKHTGDVQRILNMWQHQQQ